MTEMDFTRYIEELFAYYNARIPGRRTLDLWHEMTQFVPAEAMPWILRRVWETNESMPRNVPREIRELWQAWLQAHPEKRAPDRTQYSCPDCESGWLVLEKQLPQYSIPISYSAPCARCKQVKAANYMSLDDAVRNGYRRKDLVSEHTVQRQPIRELIESIGRPVPDPAAM